MDRITLPGPFGVLRLTTDSDDQWLTDTDSDDSFSKPSGSASDSSDDYSDSGESGTWGSYGGTSNSASGGAPDVQKQETLVEYVCRFCKGIVEDIGRMIAQLSETIRRTEEDAPKNHETGRATVKARARELRRKCTTTYRSPKPQRADKFRRKEK